MKGSKILLNADAQGMRAEGIISGTPYPGMLMETTTAALVGGRQTFQASSATAGAKGPRILLLEDFGMGKLYNDAYVSGSRGFLYWLQAGDEANVLLKDVVGTGDTVTVGQLFGVTNDGKLIRNSSYTSCPFQSMEALSATTSDQWVWCKYLGDQA